MPQKPSMAREPARARFVRPLGVFVLLLSGVLIGGVLTGGVLTGGVLTGGVLPIRAASAGELPAATAEGLARDYARLAKHTDFMSFSRRMATLRALGGLGTPEGQATLLHIVRTSRRLDDEVVAIMSMGPALDVKTAKELGSFVARRGGHVRVNALGLCYSQAEDPAVLTWLSGAGLRAKSKEVRQAVLDSQYFHADPRALDPMIEVFKKQSGKRDGMDLAYAAIRGLGAIGAASDSTPAGKEQAHKAGVFLFRAAGNAHERVRLAAAQVAAQQKPMDINLRGALRHLLSSQQPPVVRQAMARGIGKARLEEFIPELTELLNALHIKTRKVAHTALVAIAGKDLGYDADHWQTWLKYRTESDVPLQKNPSPSVSSYYGVQIYSDRLLFIVDLSGSMGFPWGPNTTKRIDVARSQLRKALKGLNPDTLFNIIVFSDRVKSWRKGEVLATPDAVQRALSWVEKAFKEPGGGTYMHAALEKAFAENAQIDTIFLLTDGLATDGEPIVPEAILASVNYWNRYRGVTINTFALTLEKLDKTGSQDSNLANIKKFMRQLARLTGGVAVVIDDIPEDVKNEVRTRNKPPKRRAGANGRAGR